MKNIDSPYSPLDRDLVCFESIFRLGSISKAADDLEMDQGNLSRSLKRLEDSLGFRLFHRHKRGITPNAQAQMLAKRMKQMRAIWTSEGSFSNDSEKSVMKIRVGVHPSLGQTYLPQVLTCMASALTDNIEVQLGTSREIIDRIMDRDLDIGIAVAPIKSKDLVFRSIGVESIDLVQGGTNTTEDFQGTLLLNPEMLYQGSIAKGFTFSKILYISSYELIASICEHNDNAVGVVPSGVRKRYSKLRVLRSLKANINVNLVTFPGSSVSRLLPSLASSMARGDKTN
jgi:DNA-binding transcriptional LysR family regulator